MTIKGATTASSPCTVSVRVHGLDGVWPAKIFATSRSRPEDAIEIVDSGVNSLSPPRSELSDEINDGTQVSWTGSIADGTNTWTLSGFSGFSGGHRSVGTFVLSYDPGPRNPSEYFGAAHGTIDATLLGATGTVTVHVAFLRSW